MSDTERDGEPVQFLEDGGDVVMRSSTGEEGSSRVLNVVKFVAEISGCFIQDAVTVIDV